MEDYTIKMLQHLGLSERRLKEHVLMPDHSNAVISNPTRDFTLPFPADDGPEVPPASKGWLYKLEVPALKADLHDMLSNYTVGYSMQLRQRGKVLFDDPWGYAKMPGDAGPSGSLWNADTPMHISSCSKLFTAMAMTKLLWTKKLSIDTYIWPYLAKYWSRGDGIDSITFRDLHTPRSGLVVPGAPGDGDFIFMKNTIAKGGHGMPGYLNIWSSLSCAILLFASAATILWTGCLIKLNSLLHFRKAHGHPMVIN